MSFKKDGMHAFISCMADYTTYRSEQQNLASYPSDRKQNADRKMLLERGFKTPWRGGQMYIAGPAHEEQDTSSR